ncbi:MAG: YitT family protein [Bacteroidetes bacterium]|nr:YitT family protein [Bacteroidota bacterium]
MLAIFIRSVFKKLSQLKGEPIANLNSDKAKKAYHAFQVSLKSEIKSALFIATGVVSAAFGLKGFLLSNNFIDGGATGISLLFSLVFKIPFSLLIVVINMPFVYLGYRLLGKSFAIKTISAIALLALSVAVIDFPLVTNDNLLIAIFGGFFLGAGIGFAMRGGAVIDGTEVLAIYLSKKLSTSVGDIIIVINVLIFGSAAYLLSVETAMYSMITYLSASKTLDFIVEGIEEYIGVTIVSEQHEEIRKMIVETMGRGVTILHGKRGYGKHGERFDVEIIYTVITRLELSKLNNEIAKIAPEAFVVMSSVKDTKGGIVKKRPLKH